MNWRKVLPVASIQRPSRIRKYMGTSSTYSEKRWKPKPSSKTTAGMPVRSGSVSVQTRPRRVRRPLSLPSAKGELAKRAVATGCSAREMRSFSTMSASVPKSRFTCTVQVRSIMSRPMAPTRGMYCRMMA
jgi:hypothetical protein